LPHPVPHKTPRLYITFVTVQNTICSCSLALLKIGTLVPKTCWVYESEWTSAFVTSCWFFLHLTYMMHGHMNIKTMLNFDWICYFVFCVKALWLHICKSPIQPVVTYGCETWVLKDVPELQLRLSERKVMRKMYSLIKIEMGFGG
jgi:hypothetical protein